MLKIYFGEVKLKDFLELSPHIFFQNTSLKLPDFGILYSKALLSFLMLYMKVPWSIHNVY